MMMKLILKLQLILPDSGMYLLEQDMNGQDIKKNYIKVVRIV